jgi:Na+-driven multidrug efflux pump
MILFNAISRQLRVIYLLFFFIYICIILYFEEQIIRVFLNDKVLKSIIKRRKIMKKVVRTFVLLLLSVEYFLDVLL